MRKSKIILHTLYIFLLILPLFARYSIAREVIDGVIAIVNEDVITLSEFIERLPDQDTKLTPQQEKKILDQMIEQKLLEQEAEKLGITVSDDEVDSAIRSISTRFNLSDEEMEEVLKRENLSPQAFREQWRLQLLSQKVVGAKLKGQLAVTDDEVKEYYEKHYGGTETVEEAKIAHILISSDSVDGDAQARNRADEVAKLARSGSDFGSLAREYSDDPLSAVRGGELGYFKKGDLVENLEQTVLTTPEGEIGGPVKSPAGYHVIKVLEKKEGVSSLDDVRAEIKEKLYREKAEKEVTAWIDEVRSAAYIDLRI
ncbi:peptidylprolyl isomerase [Desulfobacterota bacterium AH_259_B03_O07]|nr:peptidylprolyl isomerase [Desulfobacterota bacterium AH_259_B03_O07]